MCWLLAFWTFLWSCFLLMQYVSSHRLTALISNLYDV